MATINFYESLSDLPLLDLISKVDRSFRFEYAIQFANAPNFWKYSRFSRD